MSVRAPSHRRVRTRARLRIEGTVQGVGFRPYVYRLAQELDLAGYVRNDTRGVVIEVEGPEPAVAALRARIEPEAPPLAQLERVVAEELPPTGTLGFRILHSDNQGRVDAAVSADSATCQECLRELFDPADRRHRYPFINCTNCGPRFTIVTGVPYDRPLTTMAGFRMCSSCQAEYDDPADRRFHAQPNACPDCGPALALLEAGGSPAPLDPGHDPLQAAAGALRDGMIVAVKGIGGYHLACRADSERAVAALRARKRREDKPFALMVRDLGEAQRLVELGPLERELLCSPARPIVLAPRLAGAAVAAAVAPGAPELGVMLPYSPLHHLLLSDAGTTLVMTSGNVSDEPICHRDPDALDRLGGIADLFLVHNRPIATRTDDSVVRAIALAGSKSRWSIPAFLRRSRGYVPASIPLPAPGARRALLACGAELKSTFCVAKGTRAWVSHHIGDLESFQTLRSFLEGVEHFERLFDVEPELVAHDLHPEYLSTKYALEREGVELLGVQHHHAHLAACLAEHGETGSAIGAIYDGTGLGLDGSVWGGELLHGDLASFRRVGSLRPVPLPGGAQAIRQPWRMACAWLDAAGAGEHEDPVPPSALAGQVAPGPWRQVASLLKSGVASPPTSSVGRLFDAVAALCGLRAVVNYEGQAAIELEAACDPLEPGAYPMALTRADGMLRIDPTETVRAVAAEAAEGVAPGNIASRFHAALARTTAAACAQAAADEDTEVVVLSGGVFANRRLLERTADELAAAGLRVLTPRQLPAGDGGISYGQVAVAARTMEA